MHIASALRRKRDEIAATIGAYEARIDAARRDLAALDQAARLFALEEGGDEPVVPWRLDGSTVPEESPETPRQASGREPTLAMSQIALTVARTQVLERQLPEKVAGAASWAEPDGIPEEFFYLDWP